jgi:hypothetical protein
MKTGLTATLKRPTTADQFQALRTNRQAYRNALNLVSVYSLQQNERENPRDASEV